MAESFDTPYKAEKQDFFRDCLGPFTAFFDENPLVNRNIHLQINSASKMFGKIIIQGPCPSMDLGFKSILATKDADLNLDGTFTSRGHQKLTLSGNLDRVLKGVGFRSTFVYDICAKDMFQNTSFTVDAGKLHEQLR